jgi:nucleotide-binding universal stress UspA family protein
MRTIVAGIDGSEASKIVLRWAIEEAALRGDAVTAVHAYLPLDATWAALPEVALASIPPETLEHDAQERATAILDEALAELDTQVTVTSKVVAGRPADVLIEAARDADMLVVGSRGHGGFRGLLLGSVSHQVVTHAVVPTVVVPTRRHDE